LNIQAFGALNIMWTNKYLPMFRRLVMPSTSGLSGLRKTLGQLDAVDESNTIFLLDTAEQPKKTLILHLPTDLWRVLVACCGDPAPLLSVSWFTR
jgi:hypothetical protein